MVKTKENMNNTHTTTPDVIVKCEFSGNRANAWDTDGNKRTSEITVGCRQKAAQGNYLLGRFVNKAGKTYWKRWEGETMEIPTHNSTVDVPSNHSEILNFIHNGVVTKQGN